MQAKCPKCESTAFRMLPESQKATEVECLKCGHVTAFVATLANNEGARNPAPMHPASYAGHIDAPDPTPGVLSKRVH
jgi:Zn ribbon nucleic-acid-binding protein